MSRKTPLLVAPELQGRAYVEAHAATATEWFAELFDGAVTNPEGVALLAVGGLGRGELWPFSDLDVILVHDKKRDDIPELAERLWYPVWDRGLKLGYGVFTVSSVTKLAETELDQATSLLTAKLIAGDSAIAEQLDEATNKLWSKRSSQLLQMTAERVSSRHRNVGDVAFKIEPDLKEGRGGLRDLHALAWAERAQPGFASNVLEELEAQADMLVQARVALHRVRGRAGDILTLDDQDDVAEELGAAGGQDLMLRLALAARRIAWHSDEAWDRWERDRTRPRRGRPRADVGSDIELVDDLVELKEGVEPDGLTLFRVAEAAARTNKTIGRGTLETLQNSEARITTPWPEEARQLFAGVFLAGRSAIDVVEDLDQFDLMVRMLPEWAAVRCRPQRNVMHTFTVDRHLCEAACNAAELAEDVDRPDLLVVGALLHDIGKGYPGDHTDVGMELIEDIGKRMGYSPVETAVLVDLCRHHLLLPDVATRRDISDVGTIRAVAAAADSVEFLYLLAALTQADSIATGPSAWGPWKARLLQDLVERSAIMLEGGELGEVIDEFPTPEISELMATGAPAISGSRDRLTIVATDTPGLFGQIAGAVVVAGLDVLDAVAYSDGSGMAANQFVVTSASAGAIDWTKVIDIVGRALDGRLALSARVARRAAAYGRHQRRLSAEPARQLVNIDNSISEVATVVDVHAPDTIGLLFRITRALDELSLDISSAKVQTLGPEAVDSFYLTDRDGGKIVDAELLAELELALQEVIEAG